jgi:NADH-quinone oxidoreductase subunit C
MSETVEAPALPGDGLRQSIIEELRRRIGDGVVEHLLKPQDDLWIRVRADRWADTGRALRAMGFEYFCFLSAIDWKPSPFGRGEDDPTEPPPERTTEIRQGYAGGETRFQLLARVTDLRRHVGVTVKADVASGDEDGAGTFAVQSWHAIYAGANWHERETHEMYGIGFEGHPDLRNLYLPTDFEGYPLRKDFPLLARIVKPWPGIVDVEPMPSEEPADAEGAAIVAGEDSAAGAEAGPPGQGAAAPDAVERALGPAPTDAEETPVPAPSGAADTLRHGSPEAAPETATDTSTVTEETTESAPDHVTPADRAEASVARGAADTVVAEAAAPDVAPVAAAAAADVPEEPPAAIPTVAGTAEEVEAIAIAAAASSREADQAAAEQEAAGSPGAEATVGVASGVAGAAGADAVDIAEAAGPGAAESAEFESANVREAVASAESTPAPESASDADRDTGTESTEAGGSPS